MTFNPRDQAPRWLPRAVLSIAGVILGLLALLWVVARLRSLLFMVFIAFFLSVALEPAVQRLARHGWRRGLATSTVFLVAGALSSAFVAALVPLFVDQASQIAENLPDYLAAVQTWASDVVDIELVDPAVAGQFQDLGSLIQEYGTGVAGGIFAVGNSVAGMAFRLVTVGLFAFYMTAEGPKMRRTVLAFLPQRQQREALRIWEIAVDKTGGYVYSRAILAVVAAVFTIGVLTLLGIPYPVALGLWVGVLSQFVPVIGTYIALVLPALVAFVQSPADALWVIVALVAYQQLENYLIAPRITARTMAIHPAVSVGAVIAGASLLGAIGAVLALPAAATIQALISTVARRHELVESELLGPVAKSVEQAIEPLAEEGENGESEVFADGFDQVDPLIDGQF